MELCISKIYIICCNFCESIFNLTININYVTFANIYLIIYQTSSKYARKNYTEKFSD